MGGMGSTWTCDPSLTSSGSCRFLLPLTTGFAGRLDDLQLSSTFSLELQSSSLAWTLFDRLELEIGRTSAGNDVIAATS